MCFSRTFMMQEYYHNSSWLENGGSPEKAARSALTSAIDAYIKQQGKYNKNESGIKWQDVQDCLVLVTNCFSTQTSYENQTKKAINNRFIQQAMTAFFKERLSTYLIENKDAANKIMEQVLINKRSRENAEEDAPEHQNQPAAKDRHGQPRAKVHRLPLQGQEPSRDLHRRGRLGSRRHSHVARCRVPGRYARPRQNPQLPEGGLPAYL